MSLDRLTRREFIARGAGALAGLTMLGIGESLLAADAHRKPNIVFVFADQMRNCSLGCMGNSEVKTPNLDRMASQGLLFTDAVSCHPVCSPYRAAMLTGRYPTTNGVVTNDVKLPHSEVTIGEILKGQGYKTGYVGKWHLNGKGGDPKTDEDKQGFDYFAGKDLIGEEMKKRGKNSWKSDAETDLAIDFMKKNAASPFCLFLSWLPPHNPYRAPKKYEDLYDASKLTMRPNFTDEKFHDGIAKYYAMITGFDANIGRIMKTMDDLGIADDTIFVFTSDHGDMLGSQGKRWKNLPYEESINIPFIMRYPRKVKAGGKTDCLFNNVDVLPTLLSMCGIKAPSNVEGTDLSGIALGTGGKKPEHTFLQSVIPGPNGVRDGVREWRGVRTNRYTYARHRDKGWVLFDNKKDPYQMNNLVDKPEAKEVQQKLDAELQAWMKRIGDKFEPMETWWTRIGREGTPESALTERGGGE